MITEENRLKIKKWLDDEKSIRTIMKQQGLTYFKAMREFRKNK